MAGAFPITNIFPEHSRDAVYDLPDLWRMAPQLRADIISSTRASADTALDQRLYDATMDEVSKGWLVGPFEPDELDHLGCWIPSRRFGVLQGSKLRPIDDYSVSLINATLSAQETIAPADVDTIVACCRAHTDAFTINETTRHSSSPFHGLHRHPDHHNDSIYGRLFDIASAYKHLAVKPAHQHLAVISIWNPIKGKVDLFKQPSLPFGASASVLSFNWVATGLCTIPHPPVLHWHYELL